MAITKPPRPAASPNVDKFIEAAPDGAKAKATDTEKDSVQITLRLTKAQLERLTRIADRQGIPRAGYIKRAAFIQLDADEKA